MTLEPRIIDSHVHVGRNESRWETIWPSLAALGIGTAVVSADPNSYDIQGDRSIGPDLARPGGPYGLWYIGGNPFAGYRLSGSLLPRCLSDCDGVEWHCWFSEGFDHGSSDELTATEVEDFLQSRDAKRGLEAMSEIVSARLPIRLTESLPVTLALIERFRTGTFIIPHMGLRNGGVSRVLNALGDNPRVYFDTSLVEPNEGMVRKVGWQRVIFGSDAPLGDPVRALWNVRNLNLSPEQISAILGENAERLF